MCFHCHNIGLIFFLFYFIFKLHITVLVLPNIKIGLIFYIKPWRSQNDTIKIQSWKMTESERLTFASGKLQAQSQDWLGKHSLFRCWLEDPQLQHRTDEEQSQETRLERHFIVLLWMTKRPWKSHPWPFTKCNSSTD